MREHIEKLIQSALKMLVSGELSADAVPPSINVERTRDAKHGDFASNIAMVMAKAARCNPRDLADQIINALPDSDSIERAEIAGPGFINFYLAANTRFAVIGRILDQADQFGCSDAGKDQPVIVEFISANPTGPLHVGHGRHAAYGASVANLLAATGHDVYREYYVNDAGRQIDILIVSLWLRYLEQAGEQIQFPSKAYRGDYVLDIAGIVANEHGNSLVRPAAAVYSDIPSDGDGETEDDAGKAGEKHIDALIARTRDLLGDDGYRLIADIALNWVLEDIREDLDEFGVHLDNWFSERRMVAEGMVEHALDELRKRDDLYEKEGATWFKASAYGDEKDRVIIRENGQATYIASDIAYHLNKRERGQELLLDVLGSDHHGYVARVRAGLVSLGQPADSLEVRLVQFVSLYRGGEKAQMSTRSGQFITLRELRSDVGNDAARFFYVMRSNDQHLNFDVDLAKSRTEENPVYYIQYAHARVCSVFRTLAERDIEWDMTQGIAGLDRLQSKQETELLAELDRYPDIVELSATNRAPHHLVHYLRSVANLFHTYYNASRIILDDDATLRNARLALAAATQQVIRNGLELLGVSSPETM
ncbi:MAG: arginine--tRNA ligase [Gammaproteobacteria bacterium]|nr:arginine--tRNA ligase [Gammaproteobacteria bacterium]MDH3766870.1 arginine--tRNA ligase [Gammaproteobacteria bacterium]